MKSFLIILCWVNIITGFTQTPLTNEQKRSIIQKLCDEIERSYVYADTARQMVELVKKKNTDHKYDTISSPFDLGKQITADLHSINPDLHLALQYNPQREKELLNAETDPAKIQEAQRAYMDRLAPNFGFAKTEILEGNIGLLQLKIFNPFPEARQKVIDAMKLFEPTNALIIDLRGNGGGSAQMVQFISSYFFDKPVHLNTTYVRMTNSYNHRYTSEKVPGKKYLNKPVFVLIDDKTFSAAEEFADNFKQLKRATLIGTNSRGGANPLAFRPMGHGFIAGIPYGRAINPITQSNWEGKGVTPDITTDPPNALTKALELALKKLNG